MCELAITNRCTTLAAVAEYRAAGKAVDDECAAFLAGRKLGLEGCALGSFMRERGYTGYEEDRWEEAIRRIPNLAYASEDHVTRQGAIAALELAVDPEQDAIDLRDCQALAALALRYLTASASTAEA